MLINFNCLFKISFCLCLNKVFSAGACTSGWFGSKCQFQCHCKSSSNCGINGMCPSRKCDSGWFGLGCQYQDMAKNDDVIITTSPIQSSVKWLTDGDDSTCNDDFKLNKLEILWNNTKAIPFTWLRLKVSKKSSDDNVIVSLTSSNDKTLHCSNYSWSFLNDTTIDYRCKINDTIQKISITGTVLKSLCSLYISGGRNVALKQSTYQTSTNYNGRSLLAVDGNRNSDLYSNEDNSCTHTHESDEAPSFYLMLDSYKVVNKYILYNRGVDFTDRLKHFQLESLDDNDNILWTYQDRRKFSQTNYTVIRTQNDAVRKIRVSPKTISEDPVPTIKWGGAINYGVTFKLVLTLCEIELYGECVSGTWGLECNKTCPNQCKMSCHQDWGTCTSCVGYSDTPKYKTVCDYNKWAFNCSRDYSINCFRDYSINCSRDYSINCSNQSCTNTTDVLSYFSSGIAVVAAIGLVSIIVVTFFVFLICKRNYSLMKIQRKVVSYQMSNQDVYNKTDSNYIEQGTDRSVHVK